MRFVLTTIIIAMLSFIAGVYFPWWTIAVISFSVALLLPQRPLAAFISGFTAVFFLWVILSASINASNNGILAVRIGQLLKTGSNPSFLIFVTGFIGGLISGLASLSASYLVFRKKNVY